MIASSLLLATQLVVWHSYRADEQKALDQCVAVWNRAHADVERIFLIIKAQREY